MIEIKDGNYKAETSNGYVLLDVWTPSCQPCIRMAPILQEISNMMPDKIKIVKMNAHDSKENLNAATGELGVRGVPAFFLFKNGQMVHQWVGFKNKADLVQIIDRYS